MPAVMLLVQPPVFTRQLAGPDEVGRFVLVGGRFAMVCVAPQDPNKTLMLATYDGVTFQGSVYAGETVLSFGDEFVIEPDVVNGVSATQPNARAAGVLFADDHAHYIVVLFGPDFRLVTLGSGEIGRPRDVAMHAFNHWRLGVPGAQAGAPLWIFRV